MNSSVILNTLKVPVINNFEHLATQLSLSKELLYFLTFCKKYCYVTNYIPKKNGMQRELNIPNRSLKVVQKWILVQILEKINVSEQAMAFVPKKNGLRTNAEYHKNNIFMLEMDISNFFGSVTEKQVFKLFTNIGYSVDVSSILTNLCTYKGVLPQGAVTSPYIANLVCYHMDVRINNYCSRRDIVYTRYADDLSFSSNNRTLLNSIEKFIKYIARDEGFLINDAKTRYLSNDVKKTITGITINDEEIHVDKKLKRNLRAIIFNSIRKQDYSNNDKIRGMVAYINSIEDGYILRIQQYIEALIKKDIFVYDIKIVQSYNENKFFDSSSNMVYKGL